MGSLTIPAEGTVYVETPVIIYTIESHPVYAPLLHPLWEAVQAGRVQVITSDLTLLETLVLPFRKQDASLLAAYERLLLGSAPGLVSLLLTRDILREAARLRAAIPGLRTPDGLHSATALEAVARYS